MSSIERNNENNETTIVKEDNCQFIHFYDNKPLCDDFVNYARKMKLDIGHICCGGEGCKNNNVDSIRANEIKKGFLATRSQDIMDR